MNSQKNNLQANFATTKHFFEKSVKLGSDIVVFPEMNLTGYFATSEYLKSALEINSDYALKTVALTKDTNVTIIFGMAEALNGKFYISQVVAESGKIVGIYRKHNVINDEAKIFTPGDSEPIFCKSNKKYGITICADIDMPELYKKYAVKNCEFILECASPDLYGNRNPRNWESGYNWWRINCIEKIGKYSKDNKIAIAVATQSGSNQDDDFPGGGYLFSKDGQILAETKDYQQEILTITI